MNHRLSVVQGEAPVYAALRDWHGPACFDRCPVLRQAWDHSSSILAEVRSALRDFNSSEIVSLAAAGSLGRMEALPHSDCDLIVVVADALPLDSLEAGQVMETVWERLEPLGLRMPKSWGIFVEPASIGALTRTASLGNLDERRNVFGKRLQSLLDCQPLFRPEGFHQLQQRVLEWYATGFLAQDPTREWTYLLNDLIRYYRAYAAWQQFELKIEHDDSWYIRNAKLRTSRLTMYAGLLLLLGECSRQAGDDKIGWLLDKLTLTPLERLIWVMGQYPGYDADITRLLECYEVFMAAMQDDSIRNALIEQAPRTLDDLPPAQIPEYAPIQDSSATIMDILTRFVIKRVDDWSPVFLRYLLF